MVVLAIFVLDNHWAAVRTHARFRERKGGRAESAFGGHPANDPMRAAASWAVVHVMLAIDGMISPFVRSAHFIQHWIGGHCPRSFRRVPNDQKGARFHPREKVSRNNNGLAGRMEPV